MNKYKIGIYIFIFVCSDQISKLLVQKYMELADTLHLMPSFALHYTHNTGIAFSMFNEAQNEMLIGLSVVVMGVVGWMWKNARKNLKENNKKFFEIGFILIIAGAIGNIIDRTLYGYVIDFCLFYIGNWNFAVFNIADALITIGAGILVLDELLPKRVKSKIL